MRPYTSRALAAHPCPKEQGAPRCAQTRRPRQKELPGLTAAKRTPGPARISRPRTLSTCSARAQNAMDCGLGADRRGARELPALPALLAAPGAACIAARAPISRRPSASEKPARSAIGPVA